ncbi:glutamate ABC transporter substrate-binding protein [Actinocrinis puniceicyclus]|uniref:Glutamate ABC transporter substrate-binding protein n=1 Tax=Actinocrinis puniceicyclus TaxID=977794 RepID=A0A8J7WR60_9ACTN|nr:glutamate ABC transporter substrate-binding protein [Actinocrinis puniceicyclus]MBS2964664.1 glutamate ABC transporter substrate-binding protein [Actinocrinis puniceicyclus]
MASETRRGGARRGRGSRRWALPGTALATVCVLSACSGGLVEVGAHPSVAVPQPGSVVTGSPSQAPAGSAAACVPAALSLRPTAGDAASADVTRIKERDKLIVGVAQDQYLTGYLDSSGVESGFDIDIARQVEQAIFGTQDAAHIQFKAVTNAQRISALQTADPNQAVDMVVDTFTITCDRANQVLFSSVYYNARQRLLVLKNSGYKSLDDLGGKNVCAQYGSTSLERIRDHPSHPIAYGVTNLTDCLVALQQGQVDAISTDDTILAGLARQDPNTAVVGPAFGAEPYGIAVSRDSPGLIRFVNGVLEQIRGDGTWQKIYDNWLGPLLGAQQPPPAQYAH